MVITGICYLYRDLVEIQLDTLYSYIDMVRIGIIQENDKERVMKDI